MSFTLRWATGVTLQHHQILLPPQKITLMIDPCHIWNVIYNARSHRRHPPPSPNSAPATKKNSQDWSSSHMKRYLHCAEQQPSPSNITKCQILPLPQNDIPKSERNLLKTAETSCTMYKARPIRAWSDLTMGPQVRNPPRNRDYFLRSPRVFAIEKCKISRSRYHSKFHQILPLPQKIGSDD